MKKLSKSTLIPAVMILLAGFQAFGSGAKLRMVLPVSDQDSVVISPADTVRIPDSLEFKDPFKFKYYYAIKDTVRLSEVRDSLMEAGDSLELAKLDSLYIKDSTEVAKWKFALWYNSLSRRERKAYDYEQSLPAKIAAVDSILARKDSIRQHKDSVKENTPRILETYVFPDSLLYKRLLTWTHDRKFNDVKLEELDTTYNYHFYDYPFYQKDVNATYLGVVGSAVQSYNWFKRSEEENVSFYSPYQDYSYTPETLPMFNTKTPYTELAYWGTLFTNRKKEESDIRILTTQNITPALNLTLGYLRFGGNGILKNEATDNRTALIAGNYTGKKYLMHAGFIYNKMGRTENGGAIDDSGEGFNWIRDTTVDAREIDVNLSDASNLIKKHTVFLDQSYRIPLSFLHNIGHKKDTLVVKDKGDSLDRDVTTAFIGHASEYSVFRKIYKDEIGATDVNGRNLYFNKFYINPFESNDSLRVMRLENKLFIRLQPWKEDGIVSKLDVGLGDKLLNYYTFRPESYISGPQNVSRNSVYAYAGVKGQYEKYFLWDADGKYTFVGSEINDFGIHANLQANIYPFRKHKDSPMSFGVHFKTDLKEPDYYQQHLYTNHHKWDNEFSKISTTRIEGSIEIPHWKLKLEAGYALLANNIYYDSLSVVRQNTTAMSVFSTYLYKDFQIWKFHLDNKLLLQLSSNQEVLPLPLLAANLKYYFQFDVVKKVMQMQLGANVWFTTNWYSPAYSPALGQFYNQRETKYGTTPYIDVFANIQWKRACVFVKCVNAGMGWPMESADYFSAHHYIRPTRTVRVGVFWPFYVQNASKSKKK